MWSQEITYTIFPVDCDFDIAAEKLALEKISPPLFYYVSFMYSHFCFSSTFSLLTSLIFFFYFLDSSWMLQNPGRMTTCW